MLQVDALLVEPYASQGKKRGLFKTSDIAGASAVQRAIA